MKVAFVFSGYGTQWIGMGKDLYDRYRSVQELFEEAASCLDTNFVKLAFASSDAELKKVEHAHLVLLIITVAIARVLQEHGVTPVMVTGDDVGEYAAAVTAGALSFPDALYLVKKITHFYQLFLEENAVAAIKISGMEKEMVQQLCEEATKGSESAALAVVLEDQKYIVTGTEKAIVEITEAAKGFSKAKVKPAPVGGGLHSPLVGQVLNVIRPYLEKVDFKDTSIDMVAGVIGEPLRSGNMIRAALMQHMCAPTDWTKIEDALATCDLILEVGPGNDLRTLIAHRYPEKHVQSVGSFKDIQRVVYLVTNVFLPDADPENAPETDTKGSHNE